MNIFNFLLVASQNTEDIVEATTNVENVWAIENSFLIILSIILIAILIAFANRVNKLEDAIKAINERFDGLTNTLMEISKRPCQIESFGYCVYCSKNKKEIIYRTILHEDINDNEKSKTTEETTKQ